MKCILLLTVFTLPILIFAEPSVFFTWGKRQVDDRLLGSYHEKQGPYPDNRELTFYFEHVLKGKHFTAYAVSGEPLFGNRTIEGFDTNEKAWFRLTLKNSTGYEAWFNVYGFDFSPGPIYP